MVLPDSRRISRVRRYSGATQERFSFHLQDFHLLRSPFPVTLRAVRLGKTFVTPSSCTETCGLSYNPRLATAVPLHVIGFGLFPVRSPLLGESLLFYFPPGTKMLHFPGLSSRAYLIWSLDLPDLPAGVLPFGYPRIKAYSATTRGLSQPITPFIVSICQGIHHLLLLHLHVISHSIHFSKTKRFSPLLQTRQPPPNLLLLSVFGVVSQRRDGVYQALLALSRKRTYRSVTGLFRTLQPTALSTGKATVTPSHNSSSS